MSQQLNLLPEKRMSASPLLVAMGVWGVSLVLVASIWGVNYYRLTSAKAREAASAMELKEAQAIIKGREDVRAALAADLAALAPLAVSAADLVGKARAMGVEHGYKEHFAMISGATESGTWLTSIQISNGGRAVNLSGKSLNRDAVLQLSRGLNEKFNPQGVKFTTLDLRQVQNGGVPGSGQSLDLTEFSIK